MRSVFTRVQRFLLVAIGFSTLLIASPSAHAIAKRVQTPLTLFFPFVLDVNGFNTQISILNTSADSLGTEPSSGTCTLTYKGGVQNLTATTEVIPAGGTLSFTLSAGNAAAGVPAAPGFEGYLIADCNFSQARGTYRLISNSSALTAASQAEVLGFPVDTAAHPLLFHYVANVGGSDTALVLANASGEFGSHAGNGTCTLSFSGNMPVDPYTTPVISAGSTFANLLSTITPGFEGYVIANCNFQMARGYQFVSNVGTSTFAYSEDVEILPAVRDAANVPVLFSLAFAGNGRDSHIVIANTGQDSLGSAGKSGTCTLDYFDSANSANPPSETTPMIAPGGFFEFNLSAGSGPISAHASFLGHILATCNFPFARGSAQWKTTSTSNVLALLPVELVPAPRSTQDIPVMQLVNTFPSNAEIYISNTTGDAQGLGPPPILHQAETGPAPLLTGVGLGDKGKSGTCTFEYHGATSGALPQSSTTVTIPAGKTVQYNLPSGSGDSGLIGTASFEGYVIAKCTFPDARLYSTNLPNAAFGVEDELINPVDTDGDGTPDIDDQCPNDKNKIVPAGCGCGAVDTDSDGDGTPDCHDQCPNDPDKTAPGLCGCGVTESSTDDNRNGILDCLYNRDLSASYKRVSTLVKGLTPLKLTGDAKKDAKKKKQLAARKKNINNLLTFIATAVAKHAANITVAKSGEDIHSITKQTNAAVKLALKLRPAKFSKDKSAALKNLKNAVAALA